MNKNPIRSSRQGIQVVKSEDYFLNLSQESILEIILTNYGQTVLHMKQEVQRYTKRPVYPSVPDSKIRQAYQRIKQPKFATIQEILNILK